MNKKYISKTIVYTFTTALMLSSFVLSDNKVFAFLGFDLFGTGGEDKSTATNSQSSTSLQNARCSSPTGNIVDSCNSGDASNTESTGYNMLGQ